MNGAEPAEPLSGIGAGVSAQGHAREIEEKGAVVVWPTFDATGRPPAEILRQFPIWWPKCRARSRVGFQGRMPSMRLGWSIDPAASAWRCTGRSSTNRSCQQPLSPLPPLELPLRLRNRPRRLNKCTAGGATAGSTAASHRGAAAFDAAGNRSVPASVIAFARLDLAAEQPIHQRRVGQRERQKHQRAEQHEDLARRTAAACQTVIEAARDKETRRSQAQIAEQKHRD